MGIAFQLQDDSAGGGWGQSETRLRQAPNDLEERKRSLPVVLAGQANPTTVAALLATTGEPATVELLEVLDDLAIRPFGKLRTPPRAQALAQEAAGEALRALKDLHLKPPWEGRFEQLIQFVVARAV
jgi:geranylgeranyl pyrophosphate synthase